MSTSVKEVKVQIKSFLGSERAYWHGNSLRVALPIELVEKLNLTRIRGKLISNRGKKKKFLFFETDKGILIKVVDEETEKRLKDVFGFIDLFRLSNEGLKLIFG